MGKAINYGVTVAIEERLAGVIASNVAGQATTAEKLGAVASGLLADLASGGVMLAPEWAKRVEASVGSLDPQAIVAKVEAAAGRLGEAMVVTWVLDPVWQGWLLQQCEVWGITIEQCLKSHQDHMLIQGHLGSSAPDPFKLLLSQEQYRWLQQRLKKDLITGNDVIECLQDEDSAAFAGQVEQETDLLIESLKGD